MDHSNKRLLTSRLICAYCLNYYAVQGGSNSLDRWMKSCGVTTQMKVTQQFFVVVPFIML